MSVGFSETPVILSLDGTPDYCDPSGCHPKSWSDSINNYRIHYFSGEVLKHVDLAPTREKYHDIQPLGSERWLLVRAIAGSNKNAHIYSDCGELICSFHVNSGVQGVYNIQANGIGQIWMTPDCGWGTELVCVDETGHLIFESEGEKLSLYSSLHTLFCRAMNFVSCSDIWTYWDTAFGGFSLVHISNFEIRREWVPFPLRYSNAFAVNKEYHALFDGDYGDYALGSTA